MKCQGQVVHDVNGKPILDQLFVTDSTQIREMQQDLIKAKQEAEESNRLKSAFLANMSHEIRTPLNAIVGFSHLLSEIQDKAEYEKIRGVIKENSELLWKIVNDILDL